MPPRRSAKKQYDFFISRNKADAQWAVWIAWELEQADYSVIVQDWDFGSGSNFVLKMQDAIANADRTIAVLSPDFIKSEYTAPEWAAAFAEDPTGAKQKLVPIKVRRCSPKGLLAQISWIDLVGLGEDNARVKLLHDIKPGRRKPATAPTFPGKTAKRKPSFPGPAKASSTGRSRSTKTPSKSSGSSSYITAKAAAEKIEHHNWGASSERRTTFSSNPWLGAVVVPARQDSPYIDELALGDHELQNNVRLLALKGAKSALRSNLGTNTDERIDHLSFTQTDERTRSPASLLEAYTDGTIVYRTALVQPERTTSHYLLGDGLIIDQTLVRVALEAFLRFANSFYSQRRRDPGKVYMGASLAGIQTKFFGQMPTGNLTSFPMPDHRLEDPLHVPAAPLALTAEERRAADAVAKKLVDHFARRFRVGGALYPPPPRR